MTVLTCIGRVYTSGGDRPVAEDLNQETWLEALNGIGQCDAARGSFRNWLFGIARRRIALYYRRAGAGSQRTLGNPLPEPDELDALAILPQDVLERIEQQAVVRAAMLALAQDRRRALVWKYVDGLSVEAIAQRMEKTAKAVESLLSRAREQMRDLLRGYMACGQRPVSKESTHE